MYSLARGHCEALFHLMDADEDTTLGMNEFLTFILVVKKIQ
jgi:hypothetical protein